MAEDLVQATVNINVDGASGEVTGKGKSSSSIKIFKDILGTLKGQRDIASKGLKLAQSGLLGGAAAGALGAVGAGIVGGVAGGVAGKFTADELIRKLDTTGYEAYFDEETGERMVAEIDEKTGKIINILTEEEAVKKGILDKNKNVLRKWQSTISIQDILNKDLESIGKTVQVSKKDIEDNAQESLNQKLRNERITELMDEEIRLRQEHIKALAGKYGEEAKQFAQLKDAPFTTAGFKDPVERILRNSGFENMQNTLTRFQGSEMVNFLQLTVPNLNNGGNT